MNYCPLHLCSFLRNRFYEETWQYKLILYTIRPLTYLVSSMVLRSHHWLLGDTSLQTPTRTTLKILPRLRRQKLNVIKRGLLFQRPVLFTERLSSTALTITTRDEQSVVQKFQAFREVLKWQEGKLWLQGSLQATVQFQEGSTKTRLRPIYKITDRFKYEKTWTELLG